jgi:hypothetical protein
MEHRATIKIVTRIYLFWETFQIFFLYSHASVKFFSIRTIAAKNLEKSSTLMNKLRVYYSMSERIFSITHIESIWLFNFLLLWTGLNTRWKIINCRKEITVGKHIHMMTRRTEVARSISVKHHIAVTGKAMSNDEAEERDRAIWQRTKISELCKSTGRRDRQRGSAPQTSGRTHCSQTDPQNGLVTATAAPVHVGLFAIPFRVEKIVAATRQFSREDFIPIGRHLGLFAAIVYLLPVPRFTIFIE